MARCAGCGGLGSAAAVLPVLVHDCGEDGVAARASDPQFPTEPLCDSAAGRCQGRSIREATPLIAGEARYRRRCRHGAVPACPPRRYDWMRASFVYNASSRALVLALKYRDRLDMVPSLAVGWRWSVAG